MKRLVIAATLLCATAASAQKANDPSAKLRQVLPAKVADHVIATIADAREHSLPAAALEQQALRLSRKGAKPADIETSIDRSATNMKKSKQALENGGRRKPTNDEVVAGSALIGRGVDGSKVSEFAKSAPSGRTLAVPLYVTGSLMDRGLKSDAALSRVHERLMAKATDAQLTAEANTMASSKRPETANKAGGLAHRPATSPATGARPLTPGLRLERRGREVERIEQKTPAQGPAFFFYAKRSRRHSNYSSIPEPVARRTFCSMWRSDG